MALKQIIKVWQLKVAAPLSKKSAAAAGIPTKEALRFESPVHTPPAPAGRVSSLKGARRPDRSAAFSLAGAGKNIRRLAVALWFFLRAFARGIWIVNKITFLYCVRHPFQTLFNFLMVALFALVVVTDADVHERLILARISDKTVDDIVAASRFTRHHDAQKVADNGSKEFLEVGAPVWSQRESIRAVLFHARKENLSIEHQATLLGIVEVESGFNPMARAATTTACGLFQFVKATGERYKLPVKDCMDPWLNAQAGVRHYLDNYEKRIRNRVKSLEGPGKLFRLFELGYYLHHDGPASSTPSNDVKAVILNGTPFLFQVYKTLEAEAKHTQQIPTFTEQFRYNLWNLFDKASRLWQAWHGEKEEV